MDCARKYDDERGSYCYSCARIGCRLYQRRIGARGRGPDPRNSRLKYTMGPRYIAAVLVLNFTLIRLSGFLVARTAADIKHEFQFFNLGYHEMWLRARARLLPGTCIKREVLSCGYSKDEKS